MSYGPNYPDLFRRTAIYVDKILKGRRIGVSKAILQGATKYGEEARLVNDVGKGWERSEIHGGRVLGKVYGVVSGPGAQSFTQARG